MNILEAISPTLRELATDCSHPTWEIARRESGGYIEECTQCGHERFVAVSSFIIQPSSLKKKGGGKMKGITSQSGQWRIHAILAHNKTQCGLAIAECQEDIGPVNCGRCLKCLRRQLRSARRKLNGRRLKRGQLTLIS